MFDRDDPRHRIAAALALSALLHGLVLAGSTWTVGTAPPIRPSAARLAATLVETRTAPAPAVPDLPPVVPTTAEPALPPPPETPAQAIPVDSEPFLPASHLTRQPVAVNDPSLDAMIQVMRLTHRGMAILSLWIDRHGQISRIEIDRTNLPDEAAALILTTFGELRFKPGERNGLPVNAHIQIEVKVY